MVADDRRGERARAIGSAFVQRTRLTGADDFRSVGDAGRRRAAYVALHFLPAGDALGPDDEALICRQGEVLLANAVSAWRIAGRAGSECVTLLLPRRSLAAGLPTARSGWHLLPASPALAIAADYLRALVIGADQLDEDQADRAVRALAEMVLAALLPAVAEELPGSRAEAGLLERAIAFIDQDVAANFDTTRLCRRLACSRSALYRATAPVGGVGELVVQRRLDAAERHLRDPSEARPIAQVARDLGFTDGGQFGRRFKRHFGTTPGDYRRAAMSIAS